MTNRFWSKVEKTNSCWEWRGCRNYLGYGTFGIKGKIVKAHRYSYELINGMIPVGLEIDHLCKNRGCVNPNHLEAVTHKENVLRGESFSAKHARKTHCPQGHEYNTNNTYCFKSGGRQCKICMRERYKKYVEKNKTKVLAYHKQYYKKMLVLREELL